MWQLLQDSIHLDLKRHIYGVVDFSAFAMKWILIAFILCVVIDIQDCSFKG